MYSVKQRVGKKGKPKNLEGENVRNHIIRHMIEDKGLVNEDRKKVKYYYEEVSD